MCEMIRSSVFRTVTLLKIMIMEYVIQCYGKKDHRRTSIRWSASDGTEVW